MALGIITKGHNSFECCYVQLEPFALFPKYKNILSSLLHLSHTHPSTHSHTLHHLVSEPPVVSQGDLWGEAGFVKRRLPPGGVTATFVCQEASRWREKQAQWRPSIGTSKTLCLPPE